MNIVTHLPDGLEHVRTTPWFTAADVPPGLCREHHLAARVWGRLVVTAGCLHLVFDGQDATNAAMIAAGGTAIIPPERRHHVELGPDATFAIEIFRERDVAADRHAVRDPYGAVLGEPADAAVRARARVR